jgi:NAD(P)-dependent dehydrogenase (short-subunit alcohol dehydrogenase family)
VNIKGTYLPTHALLKRRHAANITSEASIICTSYVCLRIYMRSRANVSFPRSIGSIIAMPGFSGYQTTKTAVNRFAEFIHAEYATTGVRAFSYHPGAYRVVGLMCRR